MAKSACLLLSFFLFSIFLAEEKIFSEPLDFRVEVAPTSTPEKNSDPLFSKQSSNSFFIPTKSRTLKSNDEVPKTCEGYEIGFTINPIDPGHPLPIYPTPDPGEYEEDLAISKWYTKPPSGKKKVFDPRVIYGPGSDLKCIKDIVKSCYTIRSMHNYKALPPSEWEQNLKDFGSELDATQCDENAAFKLNQLGSTKNSLGRRLFNGECEPIENSKVKSCGKMTVQMLFSPISLIFDEGKAFSEITLTQFPLHPGSKNSWFTWRGSEYMPLLVFNPKNKSKIDDATELFGDWTFGGKTAASLSTGRLPSKWRDGFEALGFLDVNFDEEISGDELKPLSLWFDKNRDGISQEGELKHVLSIGITKLFYKKTRRHDQTKDIFADLGFERIVEGKIVQGRSVDWYGEEFSSKFEAMRMMAARSELAIPADSDIDPKSVNLLDEVDGVWIWEIDGKTTEEKLSSLKPKGMIMLRFGEDKITGSSISEIPVNNAGEAQSMITGSSLSGTYKKLAKGVTAIEFSIHAESKSTATTAEISKDGKTIRGITEESMFDDAGSELKVKYSWTAKRFM